MSLYGSTVYGQEISFGTKIYLRSDFVNFWEYFRMKTTPYLSYEETHDERGGWKTPFFIPEKFYLYYEPDVKISRWGTDETNTNEYVDMSVPPRLYLVEKKDGLLGIKKDFFTGEIFDSIQMNVYDSIFPYDNRFLACYIRTIESGVSQFTFHSGNVEWGEWKDVGFAKDVDLVGYVRGAQFGVEKVRYYNWDFSAKIRNFRPDFPDYEYTAARKSLLTNAWLLIGAPRGKEDQLIEFIYYSHRPSKTGDPDTNHYYEMRYILPTKIKSIKERRLEIR
jgi:hypothetical protein